VKSIIIGVVACVGMAAAGCGYTPREVAEPNSITLKTAVMEVAESLHAVKDRYKNQDKVGLYPSEATVVFNISASSTETTGLTVGANVPVAVSPIPVSLNGSEQLVSKGDRGNQVTIKFLNVGTKPVTKTAALPDKCKVANPPASCKDVRAPDQPGGNAIMSTGREGGGGGGGGGRAIMAPIK
jgi:hypothetical protein